VSNIVLSDGAVSLRPLSLDDVDEWMAGEDDEQIRWFESPGPAARGDVARAIEAWMESWRADGPVRHWAMCDAASGRIAGGVELRDLGGGEVNLSYVVFPTFRRLGLATRSARLALRYAAEVMGATAAVMKVLEANVASTAVARRLGAVENGTAPSDAGDTFLVYRLALTPANR
jgi:RimJ/RimL family protein N-acetyltransferase